MRFPLPVHPLLPLATCLALLAGSTATASGPKTPRDRFFPTPIRLQTVRHVVIDPGHGGDNFGAIGHWGTREKALTMEISRVIRDYLLAHSDVKVTLTREDDRAIPLRDRPRQANERHADVFISVHCNAAEKTDAEGMEVWFLSADSSNEVIHDLVQRERETPAARKPPPAPWSVKGIVAEMGYQMAHRRSQELAIALARGLHQARPRAKMRGVKQAAFGVLKEARMPAVVLEVGFISHPAEGKALLQHKTHVALARGVLKGLQLLDRVTVATMPRWKRQILAARRVRPRRTLPGGPPGSAPAPQR